MPTPFASSRHLLDLVWFGTEPAQPPPYLARFALELAIARDLLLDHVQLEVAKSLVS
jgi:hypothetical protein